MWKQKESIVGGTQSKKGLEISVTPLGLILDLYPPLFDEAPGKRSLVKIAAYVDVCRTSGALSPQQ